MDFIETLLSVLLGFFLFWIVDFVYHCFKQRETVEIPETLDAQDALHILVDELIDKNYYIADPVSGKQANAIMVQDILELHSHKNIKIVYPTVEEAKDDE